mmetsp:Transcript_8070/g.10146  ORF Transcript_8070/g.10146 Transcript_8070/m.10146 type:complete len:118 (+) Transcript_8070:179-532(+)
MSGCCLSLFCDKYLRRLSMSWRLELKSVNFSVRSLEELFWLKWLLQTSSKSSYNEEILYLMTLKIFVYQNNELTDNSTWGFELDVGSDINNVKELDKNCNVNWNDSLDESWSNSIKR